MQGRVRWFANCGPSLPTKEAVPSNGETPPPPPVKHGEEEVFYIVEEVPCFPRGYYAGQDYISKMQQKIAQGIKGKVSDIKIGEKDDDLVGQAGTEIVMGMPAWKPGKQRGKPVPVNFILPLAF